MKQPRFYREPDGRAQLYCGRVAVIDRGKSSTWVTARVMPGDTINLPWLEERSILGCASVAKRDARGDVVMRFPSVRSAAAVETLRAQCGRTFELVCTAEELASGAVRAELEFVAALIEWGCGPLPTWQELRDADQREAAAAEHAKAERWRIETETRAATRAEYEAELISLRAQVAALTSTVDRQRKELAERPEDRSVERAERQRAADLRRVEAMESHYRDCAPAPTDEKSARLRSLNLAAAEALRLAAIEIRESEVVS